MTDIWEETMKAVILAGGLGTRFAEETSRIPKPMIEIGGKPILWHIMKIYSFYGINDFIICLGYKGYIIKEYFANYELHMSDVTFDFGTGAKKVHQSYAEPWKVTLVDTGELTMIGGRIKRISRLIEDDAAFCLTYGDGLGDVDIRKLIKQHHNQAKLATITATQPPGRFGSLKIIEDEVIGFQEKPAGDGAWVNGGFFVLSPRVLDYIDGDQTIWERKPLENLAAQNQLGAYRHYGFWQPMDTLRDKIILEEMWQQKRAPWKVW